MGEVFRWWKSHLLLTNGLEILWWLCPFRLCKKAGFFQLKLSLQSTAFLSFRHTEDKQDWKRSHKMWPKYKRLSNRTSATMFLKELTPRQWFLNHKLIKSWQKIKYTLFQFQYFKGFTYQDIIYKHLFITGS